MAKVYCTLYNAPAGEKLCKATPDGYHALSGAGPTKEFPLHIEEFVWVHSCGKPSYEVYLSWIRRCPECGSDFNSPWETACKNCFLESVEERLRSGPYKSWTWARKLPPYNFQVGGLWGTLRVLEALGIVTGEVWSPTNPEKMLDTYSLK